MFWWQDGTKSSGRSSTGRRRPSLPVCGDQTTPATPIKEAWGDGQRRKQGGEERTERNRESNSVAVRRERGEQKGGQ